MDKPLPVPTPATQPFWDALKQHKVQIQQCNDCNKWVYYPRRFCPGCLGENLAWKDISGNGTVYTYTVALRPTAPPWDGDVPQLLAVVELDEGPRLTTELKNVEPAAIEVGMKVKPVFDDIAGEDITLLRYEPA